MSFPQMDGDDLMHDIEKEDKIASPEEGVDGDIAPDLSDDSSEEGDDDEEEYKRIREGFIVDEDDEDEVEEEGRAHQKPRKRRKKHHRRREEEEVLEEEDLELLEENTGTSFKKNRLIRLHRGRDSSLITSPMHQLSIESREHDLYRVESLPQDQDIQRIWDDERRVEEENDDDLDIDMDDFIEYDEDGTAGALDEQSRENRRREIRQEQQRRKKARGIHIELAGIDANAWDELHDVFGDGREYDWALEPEDDIQNYEENFRHEMKYQDVFEPSEIRNRMLTEDDDLIRAQDIPERMQLANSSLTLSSDLSLHIQLTEQDLSGAAIWVTQRLSPRKSREFFSHDGIFHHLKGSLVMAVTSTLRYLFVEEYEVPYIWTHKRDYIRHFDLDDVRSKSELLNLNELWRIYALGQKFRSLAQRRRALSASFDRFKISDQYFTEEIAPNLESVEMVADATEWLSMKYKNQKKADFVFCFHDDEESEIFKKRKMPSRVSGYQIIKRSIASKVAEGFGINPHNVVLNFNASAQVHAVNDQDLNPVAYAEQFVDPDPSKALTADDLLQRSRMLWSTELGKDPLLRNHIRKMFQEEARISVEPSERGVTKIDEQHLYYNFKYLHNKRIQDMLDSSQFLNILVAENEHLITLSINLPSEVKTDFERQLKDAFSSDGFSESSRLWNEQRALVIQDVLEQHLMPAGAKWTREYLREEVEDYLAVQCSAHLRKRVDVAPYCTGDMALGETASVAAVSWGKGDPQKDAITVVFVDELGRMREHTKLDNLFDSEMMDEFVDVIRRRKPSVIVIGGFSVATLRLSQIVKQLIDPHLQPQLEGDQGWGIPTLSKSTNCESFGIPVTYVHDDVARIYQHSKRANDEYSSLSQTARYCIGLARYVQSPLNEYAALGPDIAAISFEDDDQHLVPRDKLLSALERVIVDVTNKVGVDINRAVTDSYYQHLLPFVCGLGPRKAQVLVKKIAAMGGNLANRDQFIKNGLLTTKIFLNAAGFLRIFHDAESKPSKHRHDDEDTLDPLDNTRIHPEDYELARKMATDALELDEEDIHDEHPSHVVTLIMQDKERERKLSELNLDEFAISLYEANHEQKRHTLNLIRDELIKPFAELRDPFASPTNWDVLTMLSGETPRTLRVGIIVTVQVIRTKNHFVTVRLDSGIEGIINSQYLADNPPKNAGDIVVKGQTFPGVIIDVKLNLEQDSFQVELSSRKADVVGGDKDFRKFRHDECWDDARDQKDLELLARKKRAEVNTTRRVIKHPNFHPFTATQAEAHLQKQQRGDVVVRPSSKGVDHLAVTWKVDEGLYQHIDVTDPNADLTGQSVGSQLVVDSTHTYADLDELIVSHVQAMARRCEELMAHEKFKHGSEDELHLFLKNFLAANPAKSMYGFTLNRKRPGHFNLCFLANKNSVVQTWPIRVAPEAYYLFEAHAVGVPELCDAFKVRHLHVSQNFANAGSKTPFGAGGRTPARHGGATPGRTSIRQVGRTPNPYIGTPHVPFGSTTVNAYGGSGPDFGMTPRTSHDYQTPHDVNPPPPSVPSGVAPSRTSFVQSGFGWGQPSWI